MPIRGEMPSERRMMMQFDKDFLDKLPIFKECLAGGNETKLLRDSAQEMMGLVQAQKEPHILDVGSGDGEWLAKLAAIFRLDLGLQTARFTALEPVDENPKLREVCRKERFVPAFQRIEECELELGKYDVVVSTHSAYYYYNQPLAHEILFRLLRPGGWMIVTLVSQFCVLNALTEEILAPRRQFGLNAESYMALVSRLGLFCLKRVATYQAGGVNVNLCDKSEEHMRALQHVLARHRLPIEEVERELMSFKRAVRRHGDKQRVNVIMFFQKAPWIRVGPSTSHAILEAEADYEVDSLRRYFLELRTKLADKEAGLLELDLDAFLREVRSGQPRLEILKVLGHRLEGAVGETGGPINTLRGQIQSVIERLNKPGNRNTT